MARLHRIALCAMFAIASPVLISDAQAVTVPVWSTFDTELEGWTSNTASELSWSSVDGNPGGYIRFDDQSSAGSFIVSPGDFLGDWSNLDNTGRIRFDHRIFEIGVAVNNFLPYEIKISGPGGAATWFGSTPVGVTNWVTLVAPITETEWSTTTGSWSDLLNKVDQLQIRIELVSNSTKPGEVAGIDKIHLEGAVPIPAALPLFGSALAGLGFVGWQKRKNA